MKIYLIVLFIFIGCFLSYSQNSKFILWNNALVKCSEIENGSYKMDYKSKGLLNSDTVYKWSSCVFKKDSFDTIFGFHFDTERTINQITDMYSHFGDYFISSMKGEAKVFQNREAFKELNSIKHNYDFYYPITDFQNSEMSEIDTTRLQFIGVEKVDSYNTFHYKYIPINDSSDEIQILNSQFDFWINKTDCIPVRYSIYYQIDLSGDTLEQYDEFNLRSYSFNNQSNHQFKTPDFFVKNGIHLSEYVANGNEYREKLVVGSKVPDWKIETSKAQKLTSDNQSYCLVLFDFYYQSCYPCLKAIPFLNKLNKKYNLDGKGLLVVGINTIDPVDERFYEFIRKKQIEYQVAISKNDLNKEFKVLAYPTLFLMDNKGILIYSSEGYGEQLEVELEKRIVEYLKKDKLLK